MRFKMLVMHVYIHKNCMVVDVQVWKRWVARLVWSRLACRQWGRVREGIERGGPQKLLNSSEGCGSWFRNFKEI